MYNFPSYTNPVQKSVFYSFKISAEFCLDDFPAEIGKFSRALLKVKLIGMKKLCVQIKIAWRLNDSPCGLRIFASPMTEKPASARWALIWWVLPVIISTFTKVKGLPLQMPYSKGSATVSICL